MSELFREAFRAYHAQDARKTLLDIGAYAETGNPEGHTEADIPRLIQEVRAEADTKKAPRLIVGLDTNIWVSGLHFAKQGSADPRHFPTH